MYDKLDAAIIAGIREGKVYFHSLFNGAVKQCCAEIGQQMRRDSFRVLDGRLQALRRAGTLEYSMGKGWTVKEQA